jgi:dTDP-4-amino-4,6-dideoxygalactose transaminase
MTSTITFVASANAIRYAHGRPVLVDVNPETGLLSNADLEAKIADLSREGKKPKVIIPVDFAGAVANLPKVRQIADGLGAVVIEDAAHALGATYEVDRETHRAASCAHTHMAILSFHPVKHITTGEGGAITTQDEGLYRELVDLRAHGMVRDAARLERPDEGPWHAEQRTLGYNYRLTDFQSALGSSQLAKLARFVERRREIAALYDAAFARAPLASHVTPLRVRAGVASSYHLYVIRVTGATEAALATRRLGLYNALRDAQIYAQVHYFPVHRQPDFVRAGLGGGEFRGADAYYAGCLSLPMFPAMTDFDVARVVDVVGTTLAS